MKPCTGCKRDLEFAMFSRGNDKFGLSFKCKACVKSYDAEHYASNRIKRRVQQGTNRKLHRLDKAEYDLRYRAENISRITAYQKEWRQNNPEKWKDYGATYRARELGAAVGFMPDDPLAELIKIYGPKCIVPGCPRLATTKDHVIALANGGTHSFDNLQPMCKWCNSSKGAHHNTDYRPLDNRPAGV